VSFGSSVCLRRALVITSYASFIDGARSVWRPSTRTRRRTTLTSWARCCWSSLALWRARSNKKRTPSLRPRRS
ncbi:hypothetical protein M885DRAFT_626452, partial [Pelagophyceae sp. CCMP2097]